MSAAGATRPDPRDERPEEKDPSAAESRRQLVLPHLPPPVVTSTPSAIRRERKAARFKVSGPFDGARSATVTIAGGLFLVRPFGRRRVYAISLADLARSVLDDVAKAEQRAKRNKGRRA